MFLVDRSPLFIYVPPPEGSRQQRLVRNRDCISLITSARKANKNISRVSSKRIVHSLDQQIVPTTCIIAPTLQARTALSSGQPCPPSLLRSRTAVGCSTTCCNRPISVTWQSGVLLLHLLPLLLPDPIVNFCYWPSGQPPNVGCRFQLHVPPKCQISTGLCLVPLRRGGGEPLKKIVHTLSIFPPACSLDGLLGWSPTVRSSELLRWRPL